MTCACMLISYCLLLIAYCLMLKACVRNYVNFDWSHRSAIQLPALSTPLKVQKWAGTRCRWTRKRGEWEIFCRVSTVQILQCHPTRLPNSHRSMQSTPTHSTPITTWISWCAALYYFINSTIMIMTKLFI